MEGKDSAKEKQAYLRSEIIEKGYDPGDFVEYLTQRRENGEDIDVWTMDELQEEVRGFIKSIQEDTQETPNQSEKSSFYQSRRSTIFLNFNSESDTEGSPQQNYRHMQNDTEVDTESQDRQSQLELASSLKPAPTTETSGKVSEKDFLTRAAEEASEEQKGLVVGSN